MKFGDSVWPVKIYRNFSEGFHFNNNITIANYALTYHHHYLNRKWNYGKFLSLIAPAKEF